MYIPGRILIRVADSEPYFEKVGSSSEFYDRDEFGSGIRTSKTETPVKSTG